MGLFDRKTKRSYALEEYARRNGNDFQHKDDFGLIGYFKDFKLFSRGHSKKIRNIRKLSKGLSGEHGHFDFTYVISAGNSHQVYRQTVYYRINKNLMLPQFHLFPEKWYHQIGKWFGMQDINFMQYPEFSKNYLLQGKQEGFIRTLFDESSLIRHFKIHQNWSIEAVGYYFIMYRHAKYQKIQDVPKFIRTGNRLFDVLTLRSRTLMDSSSSFSLSDEDGAPEI